MYPTNPETRKPRLMLSVLVAIGLGALPELMVPSEATGQTGQPAVLYRRVAEAVHSLPTDRAYYVVLSTKSPYELIGLAGERQAAEELMRRMGGESAVFGPVRGEQSTPMALMQPCKHRPDSYLVCPDTTISRAPADQILIIYQSGNRSDTVMSFSPDSGDAVFFTPSALDKFVFPYYERIVGIDQAYRMRQAYMRRPQQ
jgi:hypothetical protein